MNAQDSVRSLVVGVISEDLEKFHHQTMRGPGGQPMSPEEYQKKLAQFKKGFSSEGSSKWEHVGNIVGHVLGILGALGGHGGH
jgi:hypothetical protein